MNRRDFLKSAAFTAAGAVMGRGLQLGVAAESPHAALSATGHVVAGMPYRPFGRTGVLVSPLGFGMMRLPVLPGGGVDEDLSGKMVRYGIDHGLNYIDTSYAYMGGKSEEVTGRILRDGYREKVHIATKFPWWEVKREDDFWPILDTQLERLQTDVIDFYLMHNITERSWRGVIRENKLIEKIQKAKEQGKVRHIGFSFHTKLPIFKEVINYISDWDFCQIQLNYLDTEYEAGLLGLKYAYDRGLGVVIMEPLRGGYLADPPPAVDAIFSKSPNKRTPVEWALDYLWNMPEVGVVLSGMGAMEHIVENIDSAKPSAVGMLDENDRAILGKVIRQYESYANVVPCTGCEYCHPCPSNVAIAQTFQSYNQFNAHDGKKHHARYFNMPSSYGKNAEACSGCGKCRCRCPVGIDIPEKMREIREAMKSVVR